MICLFGPGDNTELTENEQYQILEALKDEDDYLSGLKSEDSDFDTQFDY